MAQFIKDQVLQKKTPSTVTKWINEFNDLHNESDMQNYAESTWKSLKLYEDLQLTILKANPQCLNEIFGHFIKLYKTTSVAKIHRFILANYPALLDVFMTTSCNNDFAAKSKKTEEAVNKDPAKMPVSLVVESCAGSLASFYALKMRESNLVSSHNMNLRTIQELGSFVSDQFKLSNSLYDVSSTVGKQLDYNASFPGNIRNQELILTKLMEEYANSFVPLASKDPTSVSSMTSMLIFARKTISFDSPSLNMAGPRLLYQCLRVADAVLTRFHAIDDENEPMLRLRSHAISLLLSIQPLGTYLCNSSILLVSNALLHLWTRKLGELRKLLMKDDDFMLAGHHRGILSLDEELLPPVDGSISNYEASLDHDSSMAKRTRNRGLSTTQVITNASFKPVIVPEDITYYEREDNNQTAGSPTSAVNEESGSKKITQTLNKAKATLQSKFHSQHEPQRPH